MPKIPNEKLTILNAPINITEISDAIKQAKIGKSPGPEGLTMKYYLKNCKII